MNIPPDDEKILHIPTNSNLGYATTVEIAEILDAIRLVRDHQERRRLEKAEERATTEDWMRELEAREGDKPLE